jgi:RNA polymerase sigma-70 factor (ECF subfamily)
MSDALLARARTGEPAAFAALVRSHQRLVYSLALRMLADRDAAEDLSQDVFLSLHRKLSSIESGAHLVFWLRKVTAHRAIDRLRRRAPFDSVPFEEEAAVTISTDEDPLFANELRRGLLNLSPAARGVVVLRFQEDLDPMEIARTLAMPVNTVKSHLKRALKVLRERVGAPRESQNEDCAR